MSRYRRPEIPGGVFFFTVVTCNRRPVFTTDESVNALRAAFRRVRHARPFAIDAMVVLPDHLHCIWRLPEGDSDFSGRWREIKKATSRTLAPQSNTRKERSIWQRRFWDHAIRDETDWQHHLDYIHYNPVKHGHAERPDAWPWSSFRRWQERGAYPHDWGRSEPAEIADMNCE
ncbi:REP-associated tyrosine transposase [Acidihalobacter ferrooxydans]|uniref:Transposase n=1 Tax=Acidihalobacter ferrooxydans TaxID=1765967 RepID=A0A1P8UJI1_9GAMM|nr:transposase [Acidihalobacter ferrooxydans]APZ43962.1 transposase [Acidihalobacter ferrooxydans]